MHTCRHCHRSFQSSLALSLHRDVCNGDVLQCGECGERFRESEATRDGWHFECPVEDCDGAGLGEDLLEVGEVRSSGG